MKVSGLVGRRAMYILNQSEHGVNMELISSVVRDERSFLLKSRTMPIIGGCSIFAVLSEKSCITLLI